MKTSLHIILLLLLLFGCNKLKERDSGKDDVGVIPRLKLDRDTIMLGDSITGVIGGVFDPSLSNEYRQQLITSMGYRIDTVDLELMADEEFQTAHRIDDSTFRFAFLPEYLNLEGVEKKSLYAAIRVEYFLKSNVKKYIFRKRFDYYIRNSP